MPRHRHPAAAAKTPPSPTPVTPLAAQINAALALQQGGQHAAAETAWRELLAAHPGQPDALNNLANLCKDSRRPDEAEALYRQALAARPDYPEALNNLGNLLKAARRLDEAEPCLRRAHALWPTQLDIRNNLGVLLHEMQQFAAAETEFRAVLAAQPEHIEALNNLGNLHKDLRQLDAAEAAYRRILELVPAHAEARWNLGLLRLLRGDYLNGWPLYEARYDPRRQAREVMPPVVASRQWQGERLNGQHLLIWHEQGMGDEIQFARYVPHLRRQFGVDRISLVCKPALKTLLATLAGADAIIAAGQPLPAHDCWTLIGSLPGHFAGTPQHLPTQLPYLAIPPSATARWPQRFADNARLRVGLVWSGSRLHKNDGNRSLPGLHTLAALWRLPDIDFYSLHKGEADDPAEHEASQPPANQPLTHLGPEIIDFADSAAIIGELDLLITIDTAVVHLAGALGKPCWVLLPWLGLDWRWRESGTSSAWYPDALRLFRQQPGSDWRVLIDEVASALEHWRQQQCSLRAQLRTLDSSDRRHIEQLAERLHRSEK